MTRKKFIIFSAIVSAFALALPFVCNEQLTETHYTLHSEKVREPIKIAFISDLHNTKYGRDMSELINSVDHFSPDVVILGGDFFDMTWSESNSLVFATDIRTKYPCYYSLGNHEFKKTGESDNIKTGMFKLGINVLDGKYADIKVKGDTVRIHGIDGGSYRDQLDACKRSILPDAYNILVNHYPEEFPRMSTLGFDLILSGHAHGGQWRFPLLLPNGVISPGEGLFPHYTGGLYTENGSQMIVSRGLARCPRDILIPRIFNRPEIVFITISK
ncbi:MAG: metallophosphoesterase [Ruminiclostridium sp.]|nr:metallophosphoesterase [Ruminiclostridium sp.]